MRFPQSHWCESSPSGDLPAEVQPRWRDNHRPCRHGVSRGFAVSVPAATCSGELMAALQAGQSGTQAGQRVPCLSWLS